MSLVLSADGGVGVSSAVVGVPSGSSPDSQSHPGESL